MKKYIVFAIIALIVVAIFSNMSYEQQTIVPQLRELLADKPFENALSHIELHYWNKTISVETSGYFYFVEFLIRKGTHFFGYGIVGLIFYKLYRRVKWPVPMILAIMTVFLIGCLDEIRQDFLPGRTGIFQDVLIDTTGAIVVIVLAKIIHVLLHAFRPQKSYTDSSH